MISNAISSVCKRQKVLEDEDTVEENADSLSDSSTDKTPSEETRKDSGNEKGKSKKNSKSSWLEWLLDEYCHYTFSWSSMTIMFRRLLGIGVAVWLATLSYPVLANIVSPNQVNQVSPPTSNEL
jgi:hypothetical protein